jgi:Flp pilus assembly pilin Flp
MEAEMFELLSIWRDDQGQDLVEYSLIIAALVLLGTAAVLGGFRPTVNAIWTTANTRVTQAGIAAAGGN